MSQTRLALEEEPFGPAAAHGEEAAAEQALEAFARDLFGKLSALDPREGSFDAKMDVLVFLAGMVIDSRKTNQPRR